MAQTFSGSTQAPCSVIFMTFIIDCYPDFCPECGMKLSASEKESRKHQLEDFNAGASSQCDCGARFQFVPCNAIQLVASSFGDAGQYW